MTTYSFRHLLQLWRHKVSPWLRRPVTWLVLLALVLGYIVSIQNERIEALTARVNELSQTGPGSTPARLSNLEFIVNDHTEHLRTLDVKVFQLQVDQADLDWRTTTNRWDIDEQIK
ncbi:MAG: hypothetical protein E6007_04070 [Negativicoccus succinicivorans]|nr:hypothetical protein [Negativicoccus succinicivorans]